MTLLAPVSASASFLVELDADFVVDFLAVDMVAVDLRVLTLLTADGAFTTFFTGLTFVSSATVSATVVADARFTVVTALTELVLDVLTFLTPFEDAERAGAGAASSAGLASTSDVDAGRISQ